MQPQSSFGMLRMYSTTEHWITAEYGVTPHDERSILQTWFNSVDQDHSGNIDKQVCSAVRSRVVDRGGRETSCSWLMSRAFLVSVLGACLWRYDFG
jgi:hypothetical protein